MADKRRKAAESKTPAKKRKVETPKSTKSTPKNAKASPAKKVTSTKVKKPEPKKTPAKSPAKTPARATKTPTKETKKTPQRKVTPKPAPVKKAVPKPSPVKKVTPKPAPKEQKKAESAGASVTRAKLANAKSPSIKIKMQMAKSLKAKATAAAKSKLKTTKAAAKAKQVKKVPVKQESNDKKEITPAKRTEPKADFKKPEEKKKETPKQKATEKKTEKKPEPASKRKNVDQAEDDQPRKRRIVTPNKKFADYELDVPSKRTITPNKKYADYETDTPAKKEKSELRSFIQDKKKTPAAASTEKSEPTKTASPRKAASEKETDTPKREITVLKPSEMKPAEKLMKKLQKKLEKEAKSASVPKPVENREKAKIKITKVVTYDKPMSSEEKEMRAINKASKSPSKPKANITKKRVEAAIPKTPKTSNDKPAAGKVIKATPKSAAKAVKPPEKLPPKPKKIKELKKEERPIQAKFMSQISVKVPDDNDKVQCWVTGISVFPSGEVIMVDMANRKIKLFSKDFEFLSQIKLETIPQDISISPVNACNAYFTKPFSKEGIQKVTLSDGKLTLKESFWTNGTNRGIACTKAGIFTSVQDGRYHDLDINHFKIDLLDYEGKVLQSVSTDSNGSRLFKLPLYFTVNSTGKQVIVADCIKHLSNVVSVDMSGKIRFKYDSINNNLVTPRGLTIDDDDNIYVTEWERHNVFILSPAGKRLQVLFTNEELREEGLDGLQKPYQLCYYKKNNARQLLVSQEGCNTVKLFTLLKKGPETEAAAAAEAKAAAEKKSLTNGEAKSNNSRTAIKKGASPTEEVQSKPTIEGQKQLTPMPVEIVVQKPAPAKPVTEAQQSKVISTVSESTQVTDLPEPIDAAEEPVSEVPGEPEPSVIDSEPTEPSSEISGTTAVQTQQPVIIEQNDTNTVSQDTISVPLINPEFGEDFETAENEPEGMPAVQNAIDSLNDSKENQIEHEPVGEPVNTNEIQVQIYEPVNVPQTEMVSIIPQQHQVHGTVIEQPQEMEVEQVELVSSEYQQEIGIPVQEMTAQSVVGAEIHTVPVESVGHETIVYQQSMNEEPAQYIVTLPDNSANGVLQTENVQYVTSVGIQGGNYATNLAQGEAVSEIPEEMVTIVSETV